MPGNFTERHQSTGAVARPRVLLLDYDDTFNNTTGKGKLSKKAEPYEAMVILFEQLAAMDDDKRPQVAFVSRGTLAVNDNYAAYKQCIDSPADVPELTKRSIIALQKINPFFFSQVNKKLECSELSAHCDQEFPYDFRNGTTDMSLLHYVDNIPDNAALCMVGDREKSDGNFCDFINGRRRNKAQQTGNTYTPCTFIKTPEAVNMNGTIVPSSGPQQTHINHIRDVLQLPHEQAMEAGAMAAGARGGRG